MKISIVNESAAKIIYKDYQTKWLIEALAVLKRKKNLRNKELLNLSDLSVVYLNKMQIKKVNKKYRGKNSATDIISFEGDGFFSLGEILICMDVVKEKAKKSQLTTKLYLVFLLTHGLLHLLGYEHETNLLDEKEMFKLQNQIIKKVAERLAPKHKDLFYISID